MYHDYRCLTVLLVLIGFIENIENYSVKQQDKTLHAQIGSSSGYRNVAREPRYWLSQYLENSLHL